MKTIVSIVSHRHQPDLLEGGLLAGMRGLDVVVRENFPDSPSLIARPVRLLRNKEICGFGANHNKNFEAVGLDDDDWFVICNPDILSEAEQITDLVTRADVDGERMAAPFLWNSKTNSFDHNVRPFPTVLSQILSYLGYGHHCRYTQETVDDLKYPDWASGAFVAIKAGLYRELGGFDENFFMYMEDVDFCARGKRAGARVRFYSDIRMVHNAAGRTGNSSAEASFSMYAA